MRAIGLMFLVKPKDYWDDHQFLFQDIVENFQFMQKTEQVEGSPGFLERMKPSIPSILVFSQTIKTKRFADGFYLK